MMTFVSFGEWWLCAKSAARHLCKGVFRLVYSLIMGFVSLVCALWRFLVSKVAMYPNIALGVFLVALLLTWMTTFMCMRARALGAEAQRDSVSWQFSQFKESHGYEE